MNRCPHAVVFFFQARAILCAAFLQMPTDSFSTKVEKRILPMGKSNSVGMVNRMGATTPPSYPNLFRALFVILAFVAGNGGGIDLYLSFAFTI